MSCNQVQNPSDDLSVASSTLHSSLNSFVLRRLQSSALEKWQQKPQATTQKVQKRYNQSGGSLVSRSSLACGAMDSSAQPSLIGSEISFDMAYVLAAETGGLSSNIEMDDRSWNSFSSAENIPKPKKAQKKIYHQQYKLVGSVTLPLTDGDGSIDSSSHQSFTTARTSPPGKDFMQEGAVCRAASIGSKDRKGMPIENQKRAELEELFSAESRSALRRIRSVEKEAPIVAETLALRRVKSAVAQCRYTDQASCISASNDRWAASTSAVSLSSMSKPKRSRRKIQRVVSEADKRRYERQDSCKSSGDRWGSSSATGDRWSSSSSRAERPKLHRVKSACLRRTSNGSVADSEVAMKTVKS